MRASMRRGLAVLLAALVASTAKAQPYPTPPTPAAPRPLAIAAPTEARLANGLRVVVARRQGLPLVSAALVVLSGSEIDPPTLPGLASMTTALLTQGTRRRSAPQLAAAAEALGGSLDSGAGWNQASVSITVTTPRLDAALALVAEVATEPVFAPAELDRVRKQMLDSLKVAYASPGPLAALVAQRLSYGAGPYGHPAGGTPQSLPRIQRSDLVGLHRQAFRPDNAALVLAGDIGLNDGVALARRHFGAWRNPAGAAPAASVARADATGAPAAVVDMARSGQAAVVIALPLPPRQGADPAIGAVLNAVLGGGYSSRLGQEIRIRRGLSYGASSGIEPRREAALLRLTVQTKNESAAEVVALAQAELDRLATSPVDAAELAARKATLIGGFSRSVETSAGLASAIVGLIVSNRAPSGLTTRIDALLAVSADDVQRYAAAHLGSAGRRIVVAGEAASFGAALKESQPRLVTLPASALDLDRMP